MNYNDFFKQKGHQKYKKFESNPVMQEVYEFLTVPKNISEMIRACENGRPALEGVVKKLEVKFASTQEFDIENDRFLKQAIGTMIKYIIGFFGYEVNVQKNISNPGYIKSATHYKYNENKAEKKLEEKIVIIDL